MFSLVDESEVCGRLKTLDVTKAAGYDNIPPKLIKLGAKSLAGPVTSLINYVYRSMHLSQNVKMCRGNACQHEK